MMQTLPFVGPRQINGTATFFRYESGSAGGADESIRVRADGADLGVYWPGDSVELPDPRSTWEIMPTTPSAVGVVRLGVGRVQSARLSGSVRVIDEITDQVTLVRANSPTAVVGFGAVQVMPPALNVRGLILRHFEIIAAAGAGGDIGARLVAAKSTPTGFGAPVQQWPIAAANAQTTTQVREANSFCNKFLPPGWGLFHVFNINTAPATASFYQLAYELL